MCHTHSNNCAIRSLAGLQNLFQTIRSCLDLNGNSSSDPFTQTRSDQIHHENQPLAGKQKCAILKPANKRRSSLPLKSRWFILSQHRLFFESLEPLPGFGDKVSDPSGHRYINIILIQLRAFKDT